MGRVGDKWWTLVLQYNDSTAVGDTNYDLENIHPRISCKFPYSKTSGDVVKRLFRAARISAFLCLSHFVLLFANDPLKPLRIETPPIIDGKLDDPVWRQAPYVTGFRTFIPDFGHAMPESTVAYAAYDSENLFFAFRCFDNDPSTIKAEITSRDNIRPNDWVCINLDSFNDQQSLYAFYVNPFGIQSDSRFAGGDEDFSIDLIWYSSGQLDEKGYTVEVRIPLKSIRYADRNPVEMSVFFERRVSRRSEHASYPEMDPKKGYAFLTQMKGMVYADLKYYTLFEVLPAVTYSQRYRQESGSLVQYERRGDLSLTAKYGITSDLILDATYNPDFSQVEADAGQVDVNLRYGLFFPEKRPFFLEGSESFSLAATGDALLELVHTRTIVNPLVGLKLTGKAGEKNTIASIYAIDELLDGGSSPTREKAHFPILRYKRALSDDGFLGGVYAGRELRDRFNRVGGMDGVLRVNTSSMLQYHALYSHTKSTAATEPRNGHSFALSYRYGTRDLEYSLRVSKVSRDFAADAGYLTRSGILSFTGSMTPKLYPSSTIVRRIDVGLFSIQTRDEFSRLWETYNELSLTNVLTGSLSLRARYSYATEIFSDQRFRIGGFIVSGGGQFTRQVNFNLQYRKGDAIYYSDAPFQGISSRLSATLTYQPWNQLEMYLSLIHSDFHRASDDQTIYDYPIGRLKLTFQMDRYLFFRGIAEYNKFRRTLLSDFLASFTYIPGTVLHAGYGALYQRTRWENTRYIDADLFLETRRGFFFKMSYLWRI